MTEAVINFYFIRHGQTLANIDYNSYWDLADHAFPLTAKGVRQAQRMSGSMATHLKERREEEGPTNFGTIIVYNSPFYRTRETTYYLLKRLGKEFDPYKGELSYRENNNLIEQNVGWYTKLDNKEFKEKFPHHHADCSLKKRHSGNVYAEYPMGESRINTAFRAAVFLATAKHDAKIHDYRNVIVVCHGAMIRSLIMELMNYPPEWFDAEKNLKNCSVRYIFGNEEMGYTDRSYIYPKRRIAGPYNPMDTQRKLPGAKDIFMIEPQDPFYMKGIRYRNPFKEPKSP